MNDLERLKRAEEAGPMGVLVDILPDDCYRCRWGLARNGIDHCIVTGDNASHGTGRNGRRPEYCPYKEAIGIIEPNGHVVYFREGEE